MPDDIDATIPPNTKEMLDQTSKEGVERSRRISSLSSKIVEIEKQSKIDANKMSDQISKISKKQRQVREQMKGIESSTIPEIEEMAPHVNKILTGISGAVGSLATGMRRITLDTANSAKNVVGQYGRAISEDISVNRENLMAMSLAKATPIFGYFAAKFMQTDVFKSAAAKIKQSLGSAISSVGSGLKNIASTSASRVKNIFSKSAEKAPKMQEGGYVEKGGIARVHPAEVIAPIDKVLSQFQSRKGDVQEQTLETLKDLSTNMKVYGNYFQKEKMNRKGLIRDFIGGLWRGRYGRSWEFRMVMATEKLQEAISSTPSRFKLAWETIMWKHPIFRKLVGLTRGLWSTSKMFGRMIRWPFRMLFGSRGKYVKDIKQATGTDNALGQIGNILAAIHTRMMPKLDTLIRNSGALNNFVMQESGYEKQESGTSRLVSRIFGRGKAEELSMGKKSNILGPGPTEQDQLAMPYNIKLIEENTRKSSKTVKALPSLQKDQILEQKKTRRSVSSVGRGITRLKTKLKGSFSFLWKILMMGWNFLSGIASNITKYLPLLAIGTLKVSLVGAAGLGGYMIGEYFNKKIDEAFGEKGGLGKWVYDQTHKYGNKWYQVAWGFANLPLEVSTSLQNKTKKTVTEKLKAAYEKWTPGWIKDGVSLVTSPYKKAKEFREKTESTLSTKVKEAYDKYAPDSVKSTLAFITAPFKKINKWLTKDKETIEKKAEKAREETATPVTDKVVGYAKTAYKQVKKIDEAWDQMGVNLRGMYEETKDTIKYIWHLPGKIIDFIKWPFKKVSDLIFNMKQWSLQKLKSIPIIGKWFDSVEDDSWLKKAKLNEELNKDKAWQTKIDSIKNFIFWPFRKMVELKNTYKKKISEKYDNIVKNLDKAVERIADLISWPIRKMLELVEKAKTWTMEKLQDVPVIGSLLKWISKEETNTTGTTKNTTKKLSSIPDAASRRKIGNMVPGLATGGITTKTGLARFHASEAVVPLPPKLTEAITGRLIDRSDIAKRDVSNTMAESRYAAGEFGKRTGDIASQMKQGQAQINNAIVYTSNLMANTSSNMASTIADSMGSRGGFSSGDDFASQVLKCNLS